MTRKNITSVAAGIVGILAAIVLTTGTASAAILTNTQYCNPSQNANFRVKLETRFEFFGSDVHVYHAEAEFYKKVGGVWQTYDWGSSIRMNVLRDGVSVAQRGPLDPLWYDDWYPYNVAVDRYDHNVGVNYTMSGYPGGQYVSCSKYVGDASV